MGQFPNQIFWVHDETMPLDILPSLYNNFKHDSWYLFNVGKSLPIAQSAKRLHCYSIPLIANYFSEETSEVLKEHYSNFQSRRNEWVASRYHRWSQHQFSWILNSTIITDQTDVTAHFGDTWLEFFVDFVGLFWRMMGQHLQTKHDYRLPNPYTPSFAIKTASLLNQTNSTMKMKAIQSSSILKIEVIRSSVGNHLQDYKASQLWWPPVVPPFAGQSRKLTSNPAFCMKCPANILFHNIFNHFKF
jgi:hypothetical protein